MSTGTGASDRGNGTKGHVNIDAVLEHGLQWQNDTASLGMQEISREVVPNCRYLPDGHIPVGNREL